jgi:simple sugar transport system permease protein
MATALVLIMLYVIGSFSFRNFSSLGNFVDLFGENAVLGVAAVGATFVILSGGIDLSIGSVIAFTSILIALLVERAGVPPVAAVAIALVIGALFGAMMGCLIQLFELPPFLVTLAGMFLMRGLAFVLSSQTIGIRHPFFAQWITHDLSINVTSSVSWPFKATCFVAVLLAGVFVAHYTKFGRFVYALGGDEHSAKLMGLPVARTKILTYTLSGLCSAMAGVVHTMAYQAGDPASCVGKELEAIAAVVIGGTLLSGGVGFMAGTAMGVLILGLIPVLINFQGTLSGWWTSIVIGMLLLLFILLQNVVASASKRVASGHG